MSFGENLISLRKQNGLSRQELAERLNIPYTTLRNYETDQREPGHRFLVQIAKMFSVSVDALIGIGSEIKPVLSSSEALQLAQDYDKLDAWGQKAVRELADTELARCKETRATELQRVMELIQQGVDEEMEDRVPAAPTFEEEARAEAEEYYRRLLLEKKQAGTSSPSSGAGSETA